MASAQGSATPGDTTQASGSKRASSPSATEHASIEGREPKSARTELSAALQRKEISPLMPAGHAPEEEGNPQHRLALKLSGYLGHRIDIGMRYKTVTYAELNVPNFRAALEDLISHEIAHRLLRRRTMPFADIEIFTHDATNLVVNAVMKAIYARLRVLHFALMDRKNRYMERPSFPSEAELPAPFASLVQAIGRIRIRDYATDLMIAPTYAEGILNEGQSQHAWSYAHYISIVEELKTLGIPFRSVVLKDTHGGSWWLYRDRVNENRHELVMPFPVTNFSEHSAIQRALLLRNAVAIAECPIVANDNWIANFGTMLREVNIGDNLLYFRALCHESEERWRPAND